jgi:hypothetical protein
MGRCNDAGGGLDAVQNSKITYHCQEIKPRNPAIKAFSQAINPLNAELNPICHLLALFVVRFLHVSRIRVKSLNLRLLTC